MKRHPAVIVHSLRQACMAIRFSRNITLVSGHGAGWYAGAAWWMALVSAARVECGTDDVSDVLDCANAPGAAMAALRLGQPAIILDGHCPAFARVAATAVALGTTVLPARPRCLDLGEAGAEYGLAAWMTSGLD